MAETDALSQCPPDFEFWIAFDCLEAMQAIAARGEVPTLEAVQHQLDPKGNDPTVTLSLVEQGLAQVRRWRQQTLPLHSSSQ